MGPARSRLRPPIDLDRSEAPALAASCRRLSVNRLRGSIKYVMQLACAHQPTRPHVRSTFESLGSAVPRLLRRHVPVSPANGTVVDWRGSAQIWLYVHLHVKFAHVHDATIYTHVCIYVYVYIYICTRGVDHRCPVARCVPTLADKSAAGHPADRSAT